MAESTTQRLDAVTAEIESLGYGTPEYHEAMWFLLSIMARRQAVIADSLRRSIRKRERAAATRQRNREER
jgi:stalled ribosome rescue protein Dom34